MPMFLLAYGPALKSAFVPSHAPMPTLPLPPREALDQLDARHEELIRRLDELNAHIEATLRAFAASRQSPAVPQPVLRKAA
jgi:hypothetical protein